MLFYGLLDHDLAEVIEFYPSRDAAEAELAEILRDEPGWTTKLEIVAVDFGGAEPAIRPGRWGRTRSAERVSADPPEWGLENSRIGGSAARRPATMHSVTHYRGDAQSRLTRAAPSLARP